MPTDIDRNDVLVSYLTLRRVVGAMGMLLPVVLVVGDLILDPAGGLRDSISAHYGTRTGNVLVGSLFAIGWFLFAYRGYDRRDDFAGDLACLFSLAVALLPATSTEPWVRAGHYLSAGLLFAVLAYFSLYLFTKGRPGAEPTREKRMRNRVYRICGWIMVGCIVAMALYLQFLKETALAAWRPVLILETAALWAFGVSWFVKGETILTDALAGPQETNGRLPE